MAPSSALRRSIFYLGALLLGVMSAFFLFYTARLFYVTNLLRATRVGGQGAYVGAVVFPLLALLLGWGAWRSARAARRS